VSERLAPVMVRPGDPADRHDPGFRFRIYSLLMREMSVNNIIRMWDTYLVRQSRHGRTLLSALVPSSDPFFDPFRPFRLKEPTHFQNITSTCVSRSSSSGANSYDPWIFRSVSRAPNSPSIQPSSTTAAEMRRLPLCRGCLLVVLHLIASSDRETGRHTTGNNHVSSVFTIDPKLDRDADRAPALGSLHVEEPLSRPLSPFFWPCSLDVPIDRD
jgi:hypothetical protein